MKLLNIQYGVDGKEFKEMDRFFIVSDEVLHNLKPMYEKFIPTIKNEIKQQFLKEGKPKRWKMLKASYLASFRKRKSKYPTSILKLTGKMWKAATRRGATGNICSVTNKGIAWGINLYNIPYSRLHDMGGKLSGRAKGRMPQREFLKLTKDGIRIIMQKAHRFIRSQMSKGKVKLD